MEKAKKRLLDDEVGEVVGDPVDVGAFSTLILVLSYYSVVVQGCEVLRREWIHDPRSWIWIRPGARRI